MAAPVGPHTSSPEANASKASGSPTKVVDNVPPTTNNDATNSVAAAAKLTSTIKMPTYLTTKQSKAFTLSKSLLKSGQLDDAMSTSGMALSLTRQMLDVDSGVPSSAAAASVKTDEDGAPSNENELHESLGPLYYMYGTALLYSVEESDVMMTSGNAAKNVGGDCQDGAPADIEVEEDEKFCVSQNIEADEPKEEGENEVKLQEVVDPAEDLQIAWENLETARNIVSRLVSTFHNNSQDGDGKESCTDVNNGQVYTEEEQCTLLLDLAQIHTRLGDLQRANANILPCIDDYNTSLKLRTKCLGKFDKRVADSHFSLAAVYAEAPSRVSENEGKVEQFVNSLGGGDEDIGPKGKRTELTEEEKNEFRQKSLEHYLACGEAFAGLMAEMCGLNASEFTSGGSIEGMAFAKSSMDANLSKSLVTLRQRLSKLEPNPTSLEEFNDLKEMLDEIQEAMDTAEETEEGLKSLGAMKAQEIKKHEMKQKGEDEPCVGADGSATTIGFGAFEASKNTLGDNSIMSAATDQPMMVVKKKKKPQSAADNELAKRSRTN